MHDGKVQNEQTNFRVVCESLRLSKPETHWQTFKIQTLPSVLQLRKTMSLHDQFTFLN